MSVSGDRKPIFATGWGNADVAAGAGTVITPEAQDAGLWAAARRAAIPQFDSPNFFHRGGWVSMRTVRA
jgi:hypothetical protein